MPGKPGRPKSAVLKRAYQVKLALPEADAFDAYVRRLSEESTGDAEVLSAAAVLRRLVRAAIGEVRPKRKARA